MLMYNGRIRAYYVGGRRYRYETRDQSRVLQEHRAILLRVRIHLSRVFYRSEAECELY